MKNTDVQLIKALLFTACCGVLMGWMFSPILSFLLGASPLPLEWLMSVSVQFRLYILLGGALALFLFLSMVTIGMVVFMVVFRYSVNASLIAITGSVSALASYYLMVLPTASLWDATMEYVTPMFWLYTNEALGMVLLCMCMAHLGRVSAVRWKAIKYA